MRPLARLRDSNLILKRIIIPLLAITILDGAAYTLRAAADTKKSTVAQNSTVAATVSSQPKAGSSSTSKIGIKRLSQASSIPLKGGRSRISQPILPKVVPSAPAPSEPAPSEPPNSTEEASTAETDNESVTVPKSSAIIVSFPAEIMLDPKRQHNVPITLPLVRPLVDLEGNVVVPAKSLVSAQLKPMKGGDLVEVIALVIGGRVVPINAIGTLVPAQKKPEDYSNQYVPNPGPLNNVFNSLSNWQLSSTYLNLNRNARLNDYIGIGLAVANGLTTPKPKDPPAYVSISQGTVYILTLATPFSIPKKLVDTGIQLEQNAEPIGN